MGAAQWLPCAMCAKAQDKVHDRHMMQLMNKGSRAQIKKKKLPTWADNGYKCIFGLFSNILIAGSYISYSL